MNNNVKFLVLSDLHFEKYQGTSHQEFVLSQLNNKIKKTRHEGLTPVVILGGDIDNQADSYLWMSKIDAQVLFIAGNHEFWNGDYYETLHLLESKAPPNVHFLHNDVSLQGQYIVVASTLWTDIGKSLNPDLLPTASTRMNDMVYITAKKWYDINGNKEKLRQYYSEEVAEKTINKKLWNGLVEQEENALAWSFIQQVSDVLETLEFAQQAADKAHQSSTESGLDNGETDDIIEKILLFTEFKNPTLKYLDFLENLYNLPEKYALSDDCYKRLSLNNNIVKERIFQKLRKISNLDEKEILMLTHHLPFYEELLIGQHRLRGIKKDSFINKVHHQNFFVSEGTEYPEENFLYRASKGEISRKDDITHTVNYFNNGEHYLPNFLQLKVNVWIHGHEHIFNYSDYIKGIQILTNPAGSTFSILDFDADANPSFNKMYSKYHNITSQLAPQKLQDLKDSLTRSPIPKSSLKVLSGRINLWAMTMFDWTDYIKNIDRMLGSCANIVNSAIEFSSIEISNIPTEDKTKGIERLIEKTNQYVDIFNLNLININNSLNNYALAIEVRTNPNFSFQRYYNSINQDKSNYFSHIIGSVPSLFKISDFMGMFTGGVAFKNMEYLLLMKKNALDLMSFLSDIEALEPQDIEKEDIDEFFNIISFSSAQISKEKTQELVDKKWMQFLNSLKFNQNSPFGNIESLD